MTYAETRSEICRDCRPRKPPPPPSPLVIQRREAIEVTRVMRAQGFTERQIAQALGISLDAVKRRLRLARERGMATQKGAR